jgi:hypothetical protein
LHQFSPMQNKTFRQAEGFMQKSYGFEGAAAGEG